MRKDVNLIPREKLVTGFGGKQTALAAHAHHQRAQGRKQLGELAQGRIQDRAILGQFDPHQLRLSPKEEDRLEGRG